MKKPCDKTVSGEALSQKRFEEEIRKHAERYIEEMLDSPKFTIIERALVKQWSIHERELIVDVVLGVAAKTEAERTKKLQDLHNEVLLLKLVNLEDGGENQEYEQARTDIQKWRRRVLKKFEAFLSKEGSGQQQEQKEPFLAKKASPKKEAQQP